MCSNIVFSMIIAPLNILRNSGCKPEYTINCLLQMRKTGLFHFRNQVVLHRSTLQQPVCLLRHSADSKLFCTLDCFPTGEVYFTCSSFVIALHGSSSRFLCLFFLFGSRQGELGMLGITSDSTSLPLAMSLPGNLEYAREIAEP